MSWIITFANGDSEVTSGGVDKLSVTPDGTTLIAYSKRTYGPDEVVKTYVLANVRSWERSRS